MSLGMELGLGLRDFLPAPSPKGGGAHHPQFSSHFYCGQTAGWMKLVLGMEVRLSPGDFVLDGDPVNPSQKGGGAPKLSAHVYWAKWLDGSNCHLPRRLCVRWGPSPPLHKGGGAPSPIFGPFLLWPNGWMHQDAI